MEMISPSSETKISGSASISSPSHHNFNNNNSINHDSPSFSPTSIVSSKSSGGNAYPSSGSPYSVFYSFFALSNQAPGSGMSMGANALLNSIPPTTPEVDQLFRNYTLQRIQEIANSMR